VFLRLKLAGAQLLLLDEHDQPSRHRGQETWRKQLDQSEVSCIFVSHDRYFTRTAATRFLETARPAGGRENADEFFDRQSDG